MSTNFANIVALSPLSRHQFIVMCIYHYISIPLGYGHTIVAPMCGNARRLVSHHCGVVAPRVICQCHHAQFDDFCRAFDKFL